MDHINRYKVRVVEIVKVPHENPAIANKPIKRIAIFDSIFRKFITEAEENTQQALVRLTKEYDRLNNNSEFNHYEENLKLYLNEL